MKTASAAAGAPRSARRKPSTLAHPEKTDPAKCIDCLACVRACPVHARGVYHPPLAMIAAGCESKFLSPRREPEWYLAGV